MMPAEIASTAPRKFKVRDEHGQFVGTAELRMVPVNVIKIDSGYQRDVSTHWVSQHLPFDERRAGAIVLSGRAGGPYCIDGGHRLALARESGKSHINALVIDGLSRQDEARLFTRYQRERRNLTSHALYRADVVAGDEETLAMVRIVANAGFRLDKNAGPNSITAIDALRYIHRQGGDDLLARTLDLVKQIWVGEEKALSGQILKGLALFLSSAGQQPAFRKDRLERVMHACAPLKLVRLSQAVAQKRSSASSSATNVAEALHEQYNKIAGNDPLGPLTISGRKRPGPYTGMKG